MSRLALVALLFFAHVAVASAQGDDLGTQQARGLFEAGRAAFEAADYETALRHFRESYELSRRPALLYNIGVSADRLRHDQEALDAFEQFLRDAPPDAAQRADVEVRVRVLREQLANAPAGGSSTPGSGRGDPAEVLAGWAIFGVGLAALVTGGIFLGVGQSDASAVESQPDGTVWTPELADAASRAEWMRITGWVLAGVGLGAALTGIVLAVTAPSPSESAAIEIRPGGLAFIWRTL